MLDVVIRGGTVVTAGSAALCDVGIEGERIAQLGGDMQGRRTIDARGHYVFPGGIDVHVHLTPRLQPAPPSMWVDDFDSGSRAALAGGITTVGNVTYQREGETLGKALERELAAASRDAAVDFVLHPALMYPTPDVLAEIPRLAAEGHTSLKVFLSVERFDACVELYVEAIRIAGASGMLTMVHCEDGPLLRAVYRELIARGCTTPRYFPDARPAYTEAAAVERAVALARATGAPIYVVHLSSALALESCRRARAAGLPVYVETRPVYLQLTREVFDRPDAAKYVGNPPLREKADQAALWHGLRHRDIDCVCSDHAPWLLGQKLDPSLSLPTLRGGIAELESELPLLYADGVLTGRISLSRFVEVTSANAARLFGMYPQKGTIGVGSDADLVVWDPEAQWTVDGARMESKADYSVYDGREVHGRPAVTISRGEVVFESGEVTARRGRGRWVRRGPTTAL